MFRNISCSVDLPVNHIKHSPAWFDIFLNEHSSPGFSWTSARRGTIDQVVTDDGRLPVGSVRSVPIEPIEIMKGYYELKKAADGRYHFSLCAGNHEVILASQMYTEKRGAEEGIAAVRENGTHDSRFERKLSASGEPYFTLKAANGQVLGSSEMYGSEASRDNGIRSVMSNCPSGTLKDLT